jgi:hypothetical protein
MKKNYDLAEGFVFIAGLYIGVLPFLAHLFDFDPTLSVTSRLPDPWWWIVSAAVVVVGLGLLERLDRAKRGDRGRDRPPRRRP